MRTRELLGAGLVVAVGGALVIASVVGAEDGAAPAASARATTVTAPPTSTSTTSTSTSTTSTSTTTTSTTTPPTTAAPAPAPAAVAPANGPQPAPANPRARVPVTQIGTINIPAIGLSHPVYEGVWLTVLDVGPGHWPGTPMPGGDGNVVFGGHRVTHSHPFRDLDLLKAGDEIRFDMLDGTQHSYVVTDQFVVNPDAMWIVDPTPTPTLTLFACHPKGSAKQRIVIRASRVS
jgi:sortase A